MTRYQIKTHHNQNGALPSEDVEFGMLEGDPEIAGEPAYSLREIELSLLEAQNLNLHALAASAERMANALERAVNALERTVRG